MIELNIEKPRRLELENKVVVAALDALISRISPSDNQVDEDSRGEAEAYLAAAQGAYGSKAADLASAVYNARVRAARMTGWRIDATLREFPPASSKRIWFDWPIHHADSWALLTDAKAAGEEPPWMAQQRAKEESQKSKAQKIKTETEDAIEQCGGPGEATLADVADSIGITSKAMRTRIEKHSKFTVVKGVVMSKKEAGRKSK